MPDRAEPTKEDAILSTGNGICIRLRDSIQGDQVLVMIETPSAKTWTWVNKEELKTFTNDYLK